MRNRELTQRTPAEGFESLVAVEEKLRAPGRLAPGIANRPHESYDLLTKAYEVLEALESGNDTRFAEEMATFFLQIVFSFADRSENGRFTFRT